MSQDHPDAIRNDTDSKTMTRLIMINTRDSDFVILCNAIQTACKLISRSVRVAGIAQLCKCLPTLKALQYIKKFQFHDTTSCYDKFHRSLLQIPIKEEIFVQPDILVVGLNQF